MENDGPNDQQDEAEVKKRKYTGRWGGGWPRRTPSSENVGPTNYLIYKLEFQEWERRLGPLCGLTLCLLTKKSEPANKFRLQRSRRSPD
jgi:hypothetical protein